MIEKKWQGVRLYTEMTLLGGAGYTVVELLWRGRSHPSMFVVGGLCFTVIGRIHTRLAHRPALLRCVLCSAAISAVELVSGCILNRWLGLGVWDYSGMRLWYFVKIKTVSTTWYKITFADQLIDLIAVSRLRHSYCLSNGNR